jgi:hypothetical protein
MGIAAAGFADFRVVFPERQRMFEIIEKAGSDTWAGFLKIPLESLPNFPAAGCRRTAITLAGRAVRR